MADGMGESTLTPIDVPQAVLDDLRRRLVATMRTPDSPRADEGLGSPRAHDDALVSALQNEHGARLRQPGVEFEMLLGLGTELLDRLRTDGYRTRQYVVFGGEWWLYVLNRIAEQPERVYTALTDLRG